MKYKSNNNSILIFLHIPKSAGTTLKTILWQQVLPSRIYNLYEWGNHKERIIQLNHLLKKRANKISLIMGHVGYGIHSYLPGNFKYITMVRDPIKRVVSMYHHIQRDPMHQFHNIVKNMTISEYLMSKIDESSTNSQVRFISGVKLEQEFHGEDDSIGYGNGTPEQMLEKAKSNLKNEILFGITEQFEKSILLFRKKLAWNRIFYSKFNRGSYDSLDISEKDIMLIKESNTLDIKFYDYALKLFNENITTYLPHISNELIDFKKKNYYLGPIFSYSTRIIHKLIEIRGKD